MKSGPSGTHLGLASGAVFLSSPVHRHYIIVPHEAQVLHGEPDLTGLADSGSISAILPFGRTPEELAATWGHITSGGTLANVESIWVAKAVKYLPIAVRYAAADWGYRG